MQTEEKKVEFNIGAIVSYGDKLYKIEAIDLDKGTDYKIYDHNTVLAFLGEISGGKNRLGCIYLPFCTLVEKGDGKELFPNIKVGTRVLICNKNILNEATIKDIFISFPKIEPCDLVNKLDRITAQTNASEQADKIHVMINDKSKQIVTVFETNMPKQWDALTIIETDNFNHTVVAQCDNGLIIRDLWMGDITETVDVIVNEMTKEVIDMATGETKLVLPFPICGGHKLLFKNVAEYV